jgi:hypothetical protein
VDLKPPEFALAVFSACSDGQEGVRNVETIVGLQRSFHLHP